MAMFVHLTAEKQVKVIVRNGITRLRKSRIAGQSGIYAMPVMRNFYVSHQWLRELKRRGRGPIAGIYFRVPDAETVWLGHYNQAHQQMTAAEATAAIHEAESAEGFEVIIPRRITAKEIHRVRRLPQKGLSGLVIRSTMRRAACRAVTLLPRQLFVDGLLGQTEDLADAVVETLRVVDQGRIEFDLQVHAGTAEP